MKKLFLAGIAVISTVFLFHSAHAAQDPVVDLDTMDEVRIKINANDGEFYTHEALTNNPHSTSASDISTGTLANERLETNVITNSIAWTFNETQLGTAETAPEGYMTYEVPIAADWLSGELVCGGRITGTDDTSVGAAFMTDTTATFTVNNLIGNVIYNTTNSESCTITENTATTVTCTLSGAETWDSGDEYYIKIPIVLTESGTDDTSVGAAFMTDTTATFTVDALIGYDIYNTTNGESCTITDNTATTVTCTLSGAETWDSGDGYTINTAELALTVAHATAPDEDYTAYSTAINSVGAITVSGWTDPVAGTNIGAWVNTATTSDATYCKLIFTLTTD